MRIDDIKIGQRFYYGDNKQNIFMKIEEIHDEDGYHYNAVVIEGENGEVGSAWCFTALDRLVLI